MYLYSQKALNFTLSLNDATIPKNQKSFSTPEGRYEDTNRMFENPKKVDVDYHVAEWFNDTHVQLVPIIERYMKKQNTTPIGYVAWRLENDNL